MDVRFLDQFAAAYQRNNKTSKKKNLRCFPRCLPTGHSAKAFCGSPLEVCVTFPLHVAPEVSALVFVGDFVCFPPGGEKNNQVDDKCMRMAQTVHVGDLEPLARTRDDPLNPLLFGFVKEARHDPASQRVVVNVIFNERVLSWHYHWVGTKNAASIFHSFRINCFIRQGSVLSLLYQGLGPKFTIYSRRKAKERVLKTHLSEGKVDDITTGSKESRKDRFQKFFGSKKVQEIITEELLDEYFQKYSSIQEAIKLGSRFVSFVLHHSKLGFQKNDETGSSLSFPISIFTPNESLPSGLDVFDGFEDGLGTGFDFPETSWRMDDEVDLDLIIAKRQREIDCLPNLDEEIDLVAELATLNKLGAEFLAQVGSNEVVNSVFERVLQVAKHNEIDPNCRTEHQLLADLGIDLISFDFFLMMKLYCSDKNDGKTQLEMLALEISLDFPVLVFRLVVGFLTPVDYLGFDLPVLHQVRHLLGYLAKSKLVPLDMDNPPTEFACNFVTKQMNFPERYRDKSLYAASSMDFPSNDANKKKMWRRAYYLFYCSVYRKLLLSQASTVASIPPIPHNFVHPVNFPPVCFDAIVGKWSRVPQPLEEQSEIMNFINRLWGMNLAGGLYSMARTQILKSLDISVKDMMIDVVFGSFFFFQPKFMFSLTGDVLPTDAFNLQLNPKLQDKTYIGWTEEDESGALVVRIVFAARLDGFHVEKKINFVDYMETLYKSEELTGASDKMFNIAGQYARISIELRALGHDCQSTLSVFFFKDEEPPLTEALPEFSKRRRMWRPKIEVDHNTNMIAPALNDKEALLWFFEEEAVLGQSMSHCVTHKEYYKKL